MKYPPCKESPVTQIWDMTERLRALPDKGMESPQDDAGLGVWWVCAPWMAPMGAWHWHYVSLIHLRDIPGQSRPATLRFAGATHEVIAYAIDPLTPPDPQSDDLTGLRYLNPVSIVQQFKAETDAKALEMVECCLDLCVEGRLSVEADGRSAWAHLLTECGSLQAHIGRAS